jgi:hypothetical protein
MRKQVKEMEKQIVIMQRFKDNRREYITNCLEMAVGFASMWSGHISLTTLKGYYKITIRI